VEGRDTQGEGEAVGGACHIDVAQGLVDTVGTRVGGLEDVDGLAVGDAAGAEWVGGGLGAEADASTKGPWAGVALVKSARVHNGGLKGGVGEGNHVEAAIRRRGGRGGDSWKSSDNRSQGAQHGCCARGRMHGGGRGGRFVRRRAKFGG
jgi:hypothetical protein